MAIVVLLLWLATAAIGLTMLRAGGAARKAAVSRAAVSRPGSRQPGTLQAAGLSAAGLVPDAPARLAAVPLAADGSPPPAPHTRVATPPGEHPLLEFSHPALAVTGLATWSMFVLVHYRPLAWIAFGILLVTMSAGLGWFSRSRSDAKRKLASAWVFPPRLIKLHGLAVVFSITLTVLTALSAAHG
ncbi:MAG: hypothetical protein ACLQFR_30920 [Streptosporangiaceae bacterium]